MRYRALEREPDLTADVPVIERSARVGAGQQVLVVGPRPTSARIEDERLVGVGEAAADREVHDVVTRGEARETLRVLVVVRDGVVRVPQPRVPVRLEQARAVADRDVE